MSAKPLSDEEIERYRETATLHLARRIQATFDAYKARIAELEALIDRLAPSSPNMEDGGCFWCDRYQEAHKPDCPWLEVRG